MYYRCKMGMGLWGLLMLSGMGVSRAVFCADTQEAVVVERLPAMMMKSPASDAWLLDIQRVGNRLVAVGGRGVILISDDGGATWKQVACPVDLTLTTVSFVDAQNGWIGGHEATLLRTRDGGDTWTVERTAPDTDDPILKIWFSKEHGGFAIGGHSLMLRRVGETWRRRDLLAENDDEFSPHLFGIGELSNGAVLVAAESGHLFRSDVSAAKWYLQPTPYAGSWFGVANLGSSDQLVLYGMLGHVFVSTDGGDRWDPVSINTQSSLFAHYSNASFDLVGSDGTVLEAKLKQQQLTFSQRTFPVSRGTVTALVGVTADRWVAATTRGVVLFNTH